MPKKNYAYKNLKELAEVYKSGALDPEESPLRLDNDCAFIYRGGECVWRSDAPPESDLLEEALDMLGIPHENA